MGQTHHAGCWRRSGHERCAPDGAEAAVTCSCGWSGPRAQLYRATLCLACPRCHGGVTVGASAVEDAIPDEGVTMAARAAVGALSPRATARDVQRARDAFKRAHGVDADPAFSRALRRRIATDGPSWPYRSR